MFSLVMERSKESSILHFPKAYSRCGNASATLKLIGLPEVTLSWLLFLSVIVIRKSEIQPWLKDMFSFRSRMFEFKWKR